MSSESLSSTTPSIPHLPPELSDIIVDFLHDDEESLANCSLVCKDWLPVTRYHIFKNLLLDRWNVEEFVDMITHPSATVAPYIHQLTIDQGKKPRYHHVFQRAFLRLPRFNLLHELELRNVQWCNFPTGVVDSLISAFQRVADVKLSNSAFGSPTHFMSIFTRFRHLKRMSILQTQFSSLNDDPWFTNDSIPPIIQVLELGEIESTEIFDWFVSHRIPVISLSVYTSVPILSLNSYVQLLGPSLVYLAINTSPLHGGASRSVAFLTATFH